MRRAWERKLRSRARSWLYRKRTAADSLESSRKLGRGCLIALAVDDNVLGKRSSADPYGCVGLGYGVGHRIGYGIRHGIRYGIGICVGGLGRAGCENTRQHYECEKKCC